MAGYDYYSLSDILVAMDAERGQEMIIEELKQLNRQITRQTSLWRRFVGGLLYGMGFVLGSAILATIVIGVFGPWIGDIPWVRNAFEAGAHLLNSR